MKIEITVGEQEFLELECTAEQLVDAVREKLESGFELGDGICYPASTPTLVVVEE